MAGVALHPNSEGPFLLHPLTIRHDT
jgi:hypothetical protein